ncbi:UNVERIFIED_CONTAM: hypothetical protein GTU68_029026 [Idotea baltica]|nr:hypothetical protein [Idotea baltica]
MVECEQEPGSSLRVVALNERDGVLAKIDRRGQDKPLAANVSHLAIVSASKPGIDALLIDQFCIAAELAGIGAVIVINKADLLSEQELTECEAMLDVYQRAGYPAVLIDTKTPGKFDALEKELSDKTAVLVGASGVGKSSIVQRLLPDLDVRVGEISAATGFGAHTTSVTFWYELGTGGSIIDSPGVRQYSVSHLSAENVRYGYRELADAAQTCKFSNCSHVVEPGCGVKAGLEDGSIAQWRYNNYIKLAEL